MDLVLCALLALALLVALVFSVRRSAPRYERHRDGDNGRAGAEWAVGTGTSRRPADDGPKGAWGGLFDGDGGGDGGD